MAVTKHPRDAAAVDIQRRLLQELLDRLDTSDVYTFLALPVDRVVAWWLDWDPSRGEAGAQPHAVWDAVRERYPRATAFPLGPVAERAVKRCVRTLVAASADLPKPGLERVAHAYLTLFLQEATLFVLRWSNERLEDDHGFWYHWQPDGSQRSRHDEAVLRGRLLRASTDHASQLLAAWAAHRPPDSLCPRRRDLTSSIGDVFGVEPRRRARGPKRRSATVVALQTGPEPTRFVRKDAKRIVLHGDTANAELDVDELVAACEGRMHSLLHDLVEIAATVYFADIHVPRDRLFARDLTFLIPVRHPKVWTAHAGDLARTVGFLTGNTVEFRFTHAVGTGRSSRRFTVAADERCVALFSGGVDSFAGAAEALAVGSPILLSHSPSNGLRAIQTSLRRALTREERTLEAVTAYTRARGKAPSVRRLGKPPDQVLYQYGRSFLFLSLAAALALERGISTIRVYENGPVALNPSFSEARFNTKTTHPTFLREFAELIRAVFDADLQIENPFALLTKGEVVGSQAEVLRQPGAQRPSLLAETNSCWSWSHVRAWAQQYGASTFAGRHCGRCIPCIWRRSAVHAAGLTDFDDSYLADHLPDSTRDRWLSREHFTVLADLLRANRNALALSDDALVELCPDLDERGPGTLDDRLAMYRRHAAEVVAWWESTAPRASYRLPAEG